MLKAGLATQTDGPGAAGESSGPRFVPPPVGEIARLFPQLEILRLIGQGGMGAVYKARQPALDRFVALKVLPPATAGDPGFAERFNREARALARLNHPNIVAVHDFGKAGTLHYLVMEFVDGANLREVERLGELTPEQALAIVPQICEALQFAHNEGIVHRDIKPENLLLDKKGRVKITDFGIAKMVGVGTGPQNLTGAKDVVGTPHYMAPEQIEKPLSVDHRADIYSLGVVFYEMLTGELPLGKFAPPSQKVQIDVRLDEVVLHALEKEPNRRYQQASQVKSAVETIVTTPPVSGAASQNETVPTAAQIEAARERLKLPARGLIAAAGLQLLTSLGLLIFAIPAITSEGGDPMGYAAVGFGAAVFMIFATIVLRGAISMMKLRNHAFSIVASVVAAVAGPGAILGLPFGVWALVVLNRPDVRAAFAANRSPTGTPTLPDSGKMDSARSQVKGPAIGLIVTGVLDWVLMTVFCVFISFNIALKSPGSFFVWLPILAMVLSGWIIYAGLKLMQLERRGAVTVAAVLAMLVSPGNLIGLPLGIWTLVVMNRREVREAFEANRQGADRTTLALGENQGRPASVAAIAFRRGAWTGLLVFLLVVAAATVVTMLLPAVYVATARVRLTGPESVDPYHLQTEVEIIQSQPVLEPVAASLNLSQRWGQKFAGGAALSDDQTVALMKRMIDVRPIRNTALVEIGVHSDSPAEAAEIANKITETYCALPPALRANIIKRAMVPSYPIRPNVPLNIFLGVVAGGVLGFFVGTWVGLISFWRMRTASPPQIQQPDRFWRHFGVTAAVILFTLISIPIFIVMLVMVLPAFNKLQHRMDAAHNQSVIRQIASTHFYIGQAWFPQGDSIEINSVERTADRMVVKGHYNLVSQGQASLALYITSTNQAGFPEDAKQTMIISKGRGDFELVHPHLVPGLPHVSMYADGHPFASLYFGTHAEALEESKAIWITNAQARLGPVIEKVTIQTNAAFLLGQTRDGGKLVLTVGFGGLSWSSELKANLVFGAVIRPGHDELWFDVSSGTGPTSSTIQNRIALAPVGRIPRGQLIFHEGTYGPAIERIVIADLLTEAGETLPVCVSVQKPEAISSPAPSFGPVTERILNLKDQGLTEVLDLDSGKVVPPPKLKSSLDAAFVSAIMPTGVAIISQTAQHPMMLLGRQTSVAPLPEQNKDREWNDMSPQQLTESYANEMSLENSSDTASAFGDLPNTFMFKTLAGRVGLLQITGFTENPRGVKIRYKLVQPPTTTPVASALQFRLVLPEDSTGPADWLPSASSSNQFRLSRQILLDDTAIARAGVDFDPFGHREIEIRFTDAGAKEFEAITATNVGHQLAIVFRGRVLSAPVIQSVIAGNQCQVNGLMNASEANEIVDCLNRVTAPTAGAWIFSPVQERILPLRILPDTLFGWLNLDSGTVLTNATLMWESRAGYEWIRTNGLDVVSTESAKHLPTLLGFDMIIAPAPTNGWDSVTTADVANNWTLLQAEPRQMQAFGAYPGESDTFLFQTRQGRKGVLQILGFADNPPGVKVRYKLVVFQ
jgi:predicted Ser/Thr protein kinase